MSDMFAPQPTKPSCPVCGENRAVGRIEHPAGLYACSLCWTLFDGGDAEWHRWAQRRRMRARTYEVHREHWTAQRGGTAA